MINKTASGKLSRSTVYVDVRGFDSSPLDLFTFIDADSE